MYPHALAQTNESWDMVHKASADRSAMTNYAQAHVPILGREILLKRPHMAAIAQGHQKRIADLVKSLWYLLVVTLRRGNPKVDWILAIAYDTILDVT